MRSLALSTLLWVGLFSLAAGPAAASPGKSRLFEPTFSGDGRPVFHFSDVDGSTWYYLWVNQGNRAIVKQWFEADDSDCDGSRCSIDPGLDLAPGEYTWWVKTWARSGHGPWSDEHRFERADSKLFWIDALAFRGANGVRLSLDAVGDEPGGLVVSEGPGSSPVIEQGLAVPEGKAVVGVRVCLDTSHDSTFLDEVRILQFGAPGSGSSSVHEDGRNRGGASPKCFDSDASSQANPAHGPLSLRLGFRFGSSSDSAVVRAVGLLLSKAKDRPRDDDSDSDSDGNGSGNGGGDGGGDDRVRLECKRNGASDFSMDARFEDRGSREKFDASFEAASGIGFFAGQTLPVSVEGSNVGSLVLLQTLGGDLEGDLEFDTNVEAGDDSVPFPNSFPDDVGVGTNVVVGPLGCSLALDD